MIFCEPPPPNSCILVSLFSQCVCFGNIPENYMLCPELGLSWNQDFKLMVVNFNDTLHNLESNFDLKLVSVPDLCKKNMGYIKDSL